MEFNNIQEKGEWVGKNCAICGREDCRILYGDIEQPNSDGWPGAKLTLSEDAIKFIGYPCDQCKMFINRDVVKCFDNYQHKAGWINTNCSYGCKSMNICREHKRLLITNILTGWNDYLYLPVAIAKRLGLPLLERCKQFRDR